MSWTDEELDKLFSDSAGDMTFEYKKEYFKDIEKHLPISRKRDILWNGLSMLMGVVVVYLMIQPVDTVIKSGQHKVDYVLAKSNVQSEGLNDVATEISSAINTNSQFTSTKETTSNKRIETNVVQTQKKTDKIEVASVIAAEEKTSNVDLLDKIEVGLIDENKLGGSLQENIEIVDRIDLTPRLDFFVQGIGGVGQGKMLPGEKVSKLTGLGLGVEYNRNRLSASFALNGVVSHHEGMELSRVSKVYGFGSTEYKSTIEYSKLFMLESELTLGYRMGRITAYGGLNVNYLATTECSITNSKDEEIKDADIRKVYGYSTGLKSWGLKPMVGLSYDFKNRIQLGANVGAQVIETVEPEFLEGVSRPLPIEGRLYLRWKF